MMWLTVKSWIKTAAVTVWPVVRPILTTAQQAKLEKKLLDKGGQ